MVTTDLSEFGYREIKMAAELLTAYTAPGFSNDFLGDGITLNLNNNSGYVFLIDEDYNCGMVNDATGKLEQFFSCGECGEEGFKDDLIEGGEHHFDEHGLLECGPEEKEENDEEVATGTEGDHD